MNTSAQITKTYTDGTIDIQTLPVDTARVHVATRTAAPDHFGIVRIGVRIGQRVYLWNRGQGWS